MSISVRFSRGLIPAHAGSTLHVYFGEVFERAHPRSRGEHTPLFTDCKIMGGSSPLTRGARYRLPHRRHQRRLIPAHAGSTGLPLSSIAVTRAHPRSRGEHSSRSTPSGRVRGSSPLTRGALQFGLWACGALRLIPAHAGSTLLGVTRAGSPTAHPRSRGEHTSSRSASSPSRGSSPLTRGAPRL